MSKKVKRIIVSNIKWDADKSVRLPKKVIIDIDEKNKHLLEDIDGYAENLSDYLSDEYEYCHEGFAVKCEYVEEENEDKIFMVSLVYYNEENVPENGATIFVISKQDITKLPSHQIKENIFVQEALEENDCEGIGTIIEITREEFYEEYDSELIAF